MRIEQERWKPRLAPTVPKTPKDNSTFLALASFWDSKRPPFAIDSGALEFFMLRERNYPISKTGPPESRMVTRGGLLTCDLLCHPGDWG
jgi:hypothetical protein